MARIDKALIAIQVGDALYRAELVRTDPAVLKAASQASRDTTQAIRSVGHLLSEVSHSWERNAPGTGRLKAV